MIDATVEAYESWLRSWGASPATIKSRTSLARSRLTAWGLDGFTPENVQAWLGRPTSALGAPLARWSRSTYYANLSDLCSWLVATGRIPVDPMEGQRKPTRPKSLPRPLSEDEERIVLASARGRQRAWVLLARLAGMRAHEIAKIRGEDVTAQSIYIEGKGGVRASIPTHPDLWELAREYPRLGYWFPSVKVPGQPIMGSTVSNYTGKFFRENGIEGSIHRLRHSFGTGLLRQGENLRTVQRLMRHASLATTETYLQVLDDELSAAVLRQRIA